MAPAQTKPAAAVAKVASPQQKPQAPPAKPAQQTKGPVVAAKAAPKVPEP